jgi:hypothetical protein
VLNTCILDSLNRNTFGSLHFLFVFFRCLVGIAVGFIRHCDMITFSMYGTRYIDQ